MYRRKVPGDGRMRGKHEGSRSKRENSTSNCWAGQTGNITVDRIDSRRSWAQLDQVFQFGFGNMMVMAGEYRQVSRGCGSDGHGGYSFQSICLYIFQQL